MAALQDNSHLTAIQLCEDAFMCALRTAHKSTKAVSFESAKCWLQLARSIAELHDLPATRRISAAHFQSSEMTEHECAEVTELLRKSCSIVAEAEARREVRSITNGND